MRLWKSSSSGTTKYFYDGQMSIEDVFQNGSTTTVTNYAIGARGIDAISVSQNGGAASIGYPVYDTHGNMIATLSRFGPSYHLNNQRSFDPWGNIRLGSSAGDPSGRYCANLGHKQDDESGLIYMRARYYEPASGRFVSEDPDGDGNNWYSYASSDPIGKVDRSGSEGIDIQEATETVYEFLKEFGLDPTCLKVAGVSLTLAKWLDICQKCGATIEAGKEEVALGLLLLRGGGARSARQF